MSFHPCAALTLGREERLNILNVDVGLPFEILTLNFKRFSTSIH